MSAILAAVVRWLEQRHARKTRAYNETHRHGAISTKVR